MSDSEFYKKLPVQFLYLLQGLIWTTPSELCVKWIQALDLVSEPTSVEDRAKSLAWHISSDHWLEPFPPLTGENYLDERIRTPVIVFLAQQVPPVIDPLGYEGWDLFFTMLPFWQSELTELPPVVASILKGKS